MRSPRLIICSVAALALLAACGDTPVEEAASTSTASTVADATGTTVDATGSTVDTTPSSTSPDKPKVDLPATLPTELVSTDLTEGTGDAAKAGDTVVVNYIGVRSADGTEFDNSYDRGEPFSVVLGKGQVIAGWDQGLVGIKVGGRRQLDIPADLAYGDNPQGDVIQAGDALTFVVDAVAIIPTPDASKTPTVTVTGAANVDKVITTDLIVGTGAAAESGKHAVILLVAYRADTGEMIDDSTWKDGQPVDFVLGTGQMLPGIDEAVLGMKVGGRRQATIPFASAFGEAGNPDLKLPASTDLVLVLDLIASY